MRNKYEMDMCHGPLFGKILRFALPLTLTGILQLLFNTVDLVVVGQFTGSDALAAVGATSSLINLLVNLFIGLSVGTNVIVARYYGANDSENLREATHTAILTAIVVGIALVFVGIGISRPVLAAMDTPDDVLPQAMLYIRIYFIGMPALTLYNFGAAILRAIGDTRRPLYFLTISGVVNLVFNLIFVIVFHLGVAGVAIATVISQALSAVFVLLCLTRADGVYRVDLRALRIHGDKLLNMLLIGLPAGLQGMLTDFSNVVIQSSVNGFGSLAMAGNTAATSIVRFLYMSVNSVTQTALSFTSQNVGARQYKRVNQIAGNCVLIAALLGSGLGTLAYLFGRPLLGIFSPDPLVVEQGLFKLRILGIPYFLFAIMDVLPGVLRGLGSGVAPTVITLAGTCLFRILWIYTAFRAVPTLEMLYISYPVSWALTALMQTACFFIVRRRVFRRMRAQESPAAV